MDYSISITLDKRRALKSGNYPVRLQLVTKKPNGETIQKRYPTIFDYSEDDYTKIINPDSRGQNKTKREKLEALEAEAKKIAEKIKPFNLELFEKKMFNKKGNDILIHVAYTKTINSFLKRKRIGTASTYELSEKSIIEYKAFVLNIPYEKREEKKEVEKLDKSYKKLSFHDITPDWLQGYEDFMSDRGRSSATISMYLRCLRALFNSAIEDKTEGIVYPFTRKKDERGKYKIPKAEGVNKALSKEQLTELFNAEPLTPEQIKAKDFWFFSYSCNGMNIKDIANLKHKDFNEDSFSFYRAKTITTVATKKKIQVYLNDYSRSIIEKYGSENTTPDNFVFDIISKNDSAETHHAKISNFNCFISQNLKKLCKAIGLPKEISAYWARHSWATIAHNNNTPMKFIMESLGHENIQTTQNYLNSFPDKDKKKFAENLMNL